MNRLDTRPITSDDVCDAVGCTYRQLDYWIRLGLVECLGNTARNGSGSQRAYSHREVRVISVIARLYELGATQHVVSNVAPIVRSFTAEEWHGSIVVRRSGAIIRPGADAAVLEAGWVVSLDLAAARAAVV